MSKSAKSINGLMKHLRTVHNINIDGSAQKRKLRNIGYFHGYKGYRFNGNPNNQINYTDFNEVLAIHDFDMALKGLFYSQIMLIETAIKNYVLEVVLDETGTSSFNDAFAKLVTGYKSHTPGSRNYKNAFKKRLELRNKIYGTITRDYSKKRVIQHYYDQDKNIPIWAIFEVINLGEFGTFLSCLNTPTKLLVSASLNLNNTFNTTGTLMEDIIFTLKDLRNSVAHNDIIFDTRFKHANVSGALISCLQHETSVPSITFVTIIDYLILISYILKKLQVPKPEIKKLINNFETISNNLYKKVPFSIYSSIIHTDTRNKLNLLRTYI